jgi:integrase
MGVHFVNFVAFLEHTFYLTYLLSVNRMTIMNTDIVIAHPEVNAASAYLASLSSTTSKSTMRSRLNVIARLMGAADASAIDWATLNAAHVVAIVGQLSGSSSSTKNQTLAALKGVARAAWRLSQMSTDDYERIRDVRSARSTRELAGKDVEREELALLLKTCKRDDSPAGARDAAMFAISASCGLRRCELSGLSMSDIRRDDDDNIELRFIGKGDKERTAYVFNGAHKALKVWLLIRGSSPGAVFPTIDKAGQIHVEHHMSTVAIHKRFTLRCEQAGVEGVHLHDLRRTWIGAMLDAGADIVTVATLAGHSDVRTTQRYDRRPSAVRRAAACKVQVPY